MIGHHPTILTETTLQTALLPIINYELLIMNGSLYLAYCHFLVLLCSSLYGILCHQLLIDIIVSVPWF